MYTSKREEIFDTEFDVANFKQIRQICQQLLSLIANLLKHTATCNERGWSLESPLLSHVNQGQSNRKTLMKRSHPRRMLCVCPCTHIA